MMAVAGPRSATGMWASNASCGSGETPMIIAPRAFIWSAPDITSSYVSSRGASTRAGVPGSISAITPCLSSPPAKPSAWM